MATDKRDRQRANREEKRALEAKAEKRRRVIGIVKKYAIYTGIFAAAIIALRIFVG